MVDKLNAVMAEVLVNPNMIKRLDDLGVTGRKMSPAEFTKFVQDQVTDWGPAVKASGAKLN